jgi:thiol-disulfide isomerase/thioredoxin
MSPFARLVALSAALAFSSLALSAQEIVPASATPSASSRPGVKVGELAPEFTVLGPKGETIKLSDYRGKIVIVDVSATWCGPCQAAMPNNDRVYKKYAAQGVVLLGVTSSDSRENYDGWLKRSEGKYTFLMTFDPAGKDGWKESVFNVGYGVTGFPMMFVVGRDGKVLETVSGGGPGEDYRLEYALARAGVKVDLAAIPAEPKKDPAAPKSIPMIAKTAAMPAAGGMIGMGAPAKREPIPTKFGSVATRDPLPAFTVTGADGKPVTPAAFAGKPLLVHFVSSGAGPQPWFTKILSDYKDANFSTLVVFSATERADFDKWVAANPNPGYTVAWDPAGKAWAEGVTNTSFGVGMFPASVVATADGKLVSGTIGMGDKVATMLKMMLTSAKGITPTETDLAAMRTYVQTVLASGGGMTAATKTAAAPAATLLGAGTVAPDFVMRDINDQEVKLSSFKGKVVILDFWATWCGPCIASFPHTEKIAATYKDQDVVVVASGTSDTIAKFKEWIPKNQPKYPNLQFYFDANEKDSATFADRASSKLYHVSGIPTQFVIGRDGVIVASIVGNGGENDARTEGALAKAGVKVDETVAAKGQAALAADIEKAKQAAAAAADELVNPKPAFRENFGKLKKGEPVAADIPLQTVDGQNTKLSEFTKGKTVVLNIWSGSNGPNGDWLTFSETWSRKYSDQGVMFLSLSSYSSREDFDKWRTAQAGKFTFPVVWDPVGPAPRPSKPMDEMTAEEKKAYSELSKAYFPKNGAMALSGGVMAPVPHNIVLDSKGNMLGFYGGAGPGTKDSLANLLLRAGVKLAAEDMPKKVFTPEETKPEVPEARVETLKVGAVAPDFSTTDLNGKTVKISDFKGKVVILDFWAPWCGPCIASMPHTNEVAETYKDQGVVVLGSCTSDTRANFEKWVKANQEKYPHFIFSHDAAERTPERASRKLYGVSGIPTQFIIDREGKVAAISIGYLKGEVLLDAALAKAGIKVDPAILAKAVEDQKKRDNR